MNLLRSLRAGLLALVALAALPLAAQKPPLPAPTPLPTPQQLPPGQLPPTVQLPVLTRPLELRVALLVPAIDSVRRVLPSPGPAADAILLNGEPVRVVGRNLGTDADGTTLGLRSGDQIMPLLINPNVVRTPTEIAAYMPGADALERAGLPVTNAYDVVLLDTSGRVLAATPIRLFFRTGPHDDFDGDGSEVQNDCNDFDGRRYPGGVEVAGVNDEGVDEDCDYQTFSERDRDRDRFPDAAAFNYDPETRRIYRGEDCNDDDVTANPIRPENCLPGTQPHERDAALRLRLGWD